MLPSWDFTNETPLKIDPISLTAPVSQTSLSGSFCNNRGQNNDMAENQL